MRKFFEGLSPVEGTLIFVSLVFGSFFRLYDLDLVSYWSDELATVYFSIFPGEIYAQETHPPLYYLFTKFLMLIFGPTVYDLRLGGALVSVILNLLVVLYARRVFSNSGWVLFSIFIFLVPVDVVFARMARMYSLLFSLSAWFYLAVLKDDKGKLPLILSIILCWIFPLGFLPGISWILFRIVKDRKWGRDLTILSLSIIPIVLYYLSKFIFVPANPTSFYLGAGPGLRPLVLDFFFVLAGEHFPKLLFSLAPWSAVMPLMAATMFATGVILYTSLRQKNWQLRSDYFFTLVLTTIIFLQLFGLAVVSVSLSRYMVFLMPIIGVFLTRLPDLLPEKINFLPAALVFSVLIHSHYQYSPISFYPGEREAYQRFREMADISGAPAVFCGNKFQFFHYYRSPRQDCMKEVSELIKTGKDFVILDVNGSVSQELIMLMKVYRVSDFQRISQATIAHLIPGKGGIKK